MVGVIYKDKFFRTSGAFVVSNSHFIRNKVVAFAVYKKYRNFTLFNSVNSRNVKLKFTKDFTVNIKN